MTVWLAVLIDLTVRDSVSSLAFVFYATPPVVVAVLAFVLTWIGRTVRGVPSDRVRLVVNRATALLGVICLVQWAADSFRVGPAGEHPAGTLKVMFWNVADGRFASWERIAEQACGFDADVLAFAEARGKKLKSREFWDANFPGYSALRLKAGMVLLIKGQAAEKAAGSLEDMGEFRLLSLEVRGSRFDILMADLTSNPLRSRSAALAKLYTVMQGQSTIPTLVVGDFNTPPTSVCFDDWRIEWTRAWDAAGNGYQPTWPQPLPILALDHVWGNKGIEFQHCRCGWSSCSDHRPVIVEVTVKDDGQ